MFKCLEIKKAIMKGYSPSIISIIIAFFRCVSYQNSVNQENCKTQKQKQESWKMSVT